MLSLKFFVEASEEVRKKRRMSRDTRDRGRTADSVLKKWAQVEEMFLRYVRPQSSRDKVELFDSSNLDSQAIATKIVERIRSIQAKI